MSALTINTFDAIGVTGPIPVVVQLTDLHGVEVVGHLANGEIVRRGGVTTATDGTVSVEVHPNADIITPLNTYYTVWVGSHSFLIQKTGATQTLLQALINNPVDLDEAFGLQNLIDVESPLTPSDGEVFQFNAGTGKWAAAPSGEVLPAGGTQYSVLRKKTGADFDEEWHDLATILVAVWAGAWPARPTGGGIVRWIGPAAAGLPPQIITNDEWRVTAP